MAAYGDSDGGQGEKPSILLLPTLLWEGNCWLLWAKGAGSISQVVGMQWVKQLCQHPAGQRADGNSSLASWPSAFTPLPPPCLLICTLSALEVYNQKLSSTNLIRTWLRIRSMCYLVTQYKCVTQVCANEGVFHKMMCLVRRYLL